MIKLLIENDHFIFILTTILSCFFILCDDELTFTLLIFMFELWKTFR
jgi:hypothetical protein